MIRSLKLLLLSVLLVLIFIISLPLLLFLHIYRLCVLATARLMKPDLDQFLAGESNLLACDTFFDNPKCGLVIAMVHSKPIDLEEYKALFLNRVIEKRRKNGRPLYAELRQFPESFAGCFFWKWCQDFSIDNHIRHYDYTETKLRLPAGQVTESQLRTAIAELLTYPWKPGRSPWEILLINDFVQDHDPESCRKPRTILLLRIHHSLGDGFSFTRLLLHDLCQSSGKVPLFKLEEMSASKRILTTLRAILAVPLFYAKLMVDTGMVVTHPWKLDEEHTRCKEYHIGISPVVETDLVKEIKNLTGSNYNAVSLAATARGVQRIMASKMADGGASLPQRLSCLIPFPIANHPGGMVNHAAMIPMLLPLHSTSFEACLRDVSRQFDEADLQAVGIGQLVLQTLLPALPNAVLGLLLKNVSNVPMGASFFPGPFTLPYVLGSALEEFYVGCALGLGNAAAMVMCVSNGGSQRFVLTIERSVCPNPEDAQKFGEYVCEELSEFRRRVVCNRNACLITTNGLTNDTGKALEAIKIC